MLRVFRSKPKYVTVRSNQEAEPKEKPPEPREAASGLWKRCEQCSAMIYTKEMEKAMHVCTECGWHFRVPALARLEMTVDSHTFTPFASLESGNPLSFPGYEDKLAKARDATELDEAVIIGEGRIQGFPAVIGIIDFSFIGGSMGSVVGEQITRGFEHGLSNELPVVLFSGGGGGARMHEGIFSLMQMAKTSQAVGRFQKAGLFYLSVLTHPTMGGIYASFASLGDIIVAEPQALIGFAGPRIVEETTRQKLPSEFQTSEFALKHGMLDAIVPRQDMKDTVSQLLGYHS